MIKEMLALFYLFKLKMYTLIARVINALPLNDVTKGQLKLKIISCKHLGRVVVINTGE